MAFGNQTNPQNVAKELMAPAQMIQQQFMATSPATGEADSTRFSGFTGASKIQMASYSLNNPNYRSNDQANLRQNDLDIDCLSN